MEESISTSAESVRTIHQAHAANLKERLQNHALDPSSQTVLSIPQRELEREQHVSQSQSTPTSSVAGFTTHDDTHDNTRHSPDPNTARPSTSSSSSFVDLTADSDEPSPHPHPHTQTHALVLPSPPSSPGPSPSRSRSPSVDSGASESSLPSVSSSFFFSSSAPGSPGRSSSHPGSYPGSYPSSYPHSEHGGDYEHGQQHYGPDAQGTGDRDPDRGEGLVIPSLTLPDTLRRPTPFGQTLGNLRILVLGGQGAGKSFLTGLLLEDNEDVVDVGTWEDWAGGRGAYGKVLRASTDWMERREGFGVGMERYEPSKNVEIVELPGYAYDADATELVNRLKAVIETPFRSLHGALHPDSPPSAVIAGMLAAPTSPLYTAMVFLLPSPPTPLDTEIIRALSTHIPLIVLPRLSTASLSVSASSSVSSSALGASPYARLSAFRPATAVSLRAGLFHSPETVALLRKEAVERFLWWREVERAVEGMLDGAGSTETWGDSAARRREGGESKDGQGVDWWSRERWEAEWMADYSRDVAVRVRESGGRDVVRGRAVAVSTMRRRARERERRGTVSLKTFVRRDESDEELSTMVGHPRRPSDLEKPQAQLPPRAHDAHPHPHPHPRSNAIPPPPSFDPLHLPSLLFFSFSLLGPLRVRVGESLRGLLDLVAFGDPKVQLAVGLTGGFCVGLGVGAWTVGAVERGW